MRWVPFLFTCVFSVLVNAHRHVTLQEHGFVNIIGPITTGLSDAVIYELNHPLTQQSMNETKSITLFLNSPGGSVHAGSHLLQFMNFLQAQNITIHCLAENFMSMAFILFKACDQRLVTPHSIGMQHQMSFSLRGDMESIQTAFDMHRECGATPLVVHDAINDHLIEMEIERIGISREEYDQKIAHDRWVVGPENIEENTADEMVVYSCAPSLYDKVQVRVEKRGQYTFLVQHHKCPLYKNVEVTEAAFSEFYDVRQCGSTGKRRRSGPLNNQTKFLFPK